MKFIYISRQSNVQCVWLNVDYCNLILIVVGGGGLVDVRKYEKTTLDYIDVIAWETFYAINITSVVQYSMFKMIDKSTFIQ